jgi:hypothetical protein
MQARVGVGKSYSLQPYLLVQIVSPDFFYAALNPPKM